MFLLFLLGISQFITIDITSGKESGMVRINAPEKFMKTALEYAREVDESSFKINDEEISPDSLLKIINMVEKSDEPVLIIEDEEDTVKFYIRETPEILNNKQKPERLIVSIQDEGRDVNIRLPIWLARILPSFIIAAGEDADEIRMARKLIKETLSDIEKMEGGFTLLEVNDGEEKVRIIFE